jgi:hypothetical protein
MRKGDPRIGEIFLGECIPFSLALLVLKLFPWTPRDQAEFQSIGHESVRQNIFKIDDI